MNIHIYIYELPKFAKKVKKFILMIIVCVVLFAYSCYIVPSKYKTNFERCHLL